MTHKSVNYWFNLDGKVAVVTGGASGIGRATVLAFASCGAWVVILDTNAREGKKLADFIGEKALFIKTDMSKSKQVRRAAKIVKRRLGRVDFLIGNAGFEINDQGSMITMPEKSARIIMDVNLWGNVLLARAFVPLMGEGGRIVFTGSIQSFTAHHPGTTYQATKAGLLGITNALAIELAPGINVNIVCPGAICTTGIGGTRASEPGVLEGYRHAIPAGRRGHPEEVAGPILFLCSPLANYITGTSLIVDGGYGRKITPRKKGRTKILSNDPDRKK